MWLWKKRQKPQSVQTRFGEFVKDDGEETWQCLAEIDNIQVHVIADDMDGQPSPKLLSFLPYISENLSLLEMSARSTVSEISDKHWFSTIADSGKHWFCSFADSGLDTDFLLGFSYCEDGAAEIVQVYFKNSIVFDWIRTDVD